jgi:hypothetical protein
LISLCAVISSSRGESMVLMGPSPRRTPGSLFVFAIIDDDNDDNDSDNGSNGSTCSGDDSVIKKRRLWL